MDYKDDLLEDLNDYLKVCREKFQYAVQRFDILIVSLSVAGIILSFNYTRYLMDEKNISGWPTWIPLLSVILFALSIMSNFASQYTAFYAHRLEIEITKGKIRQVKDIGDYQENDFVEIEKRSDRFDKKTDIYNAISRFCLMLAVMLIIISLLVSAACFL